VYAILSHNLAHWGQIHLSFLVSRHGQQYNGFRTGFPEDKMDGFEVYKKDLSTFIMVAREVLKDTALVCEKIEKLMKQKVVSGPEIWHLEEELNHLQDRLHFPVSELDSYLFNDVMHIRFPLRKLIFSCLDILALVPFPPVNLKKKLQPFVEEAEQACHFLEKKYGLLRDAERR